MQTRTVINKIRWIRSQLPGELEEFLFSEPSETDPISFDVFKLTSEVSRFAELVARDAAASEILRAFGMTPLLNRNEFPQWIETVFISKTRRLRQSKEENETPPSDPIAIAWRSMIRSVDPIENLTTPEEMREPELPETFISFELASVAAQNTSLARLAKATDFADQAYETVCRIYETKGSPTLAVVKVDSGSSIRIDCKGLGEPIKHLKDLILEAWHKVRHKRVEEVLENNKAVLGSLAVMEKINARERDESLSREEAEQLRRKIMTSVFGLFECGALIAEIPSQETVENTELLGGFVPKRLPPPKAGSNAGTKKTARKKTTPNKRSSTRRKT